VTQQKHHSSNAAGYIILPFFNKILILNPSFLLSKRLQKFTFASSTFHHPLLRQAVCQKAGFPAFTGRGSVAVIGMTKEIIYARLPEGIER
jgi:hypothetical protein